MTEMELLVYAKHYLFDKMTREVENLIKNPLERRAQELYRKYESHYIECLRRIDEIERCPF